MKLNLDKCEFWLIRSKRMTLLVIYTVFQKNMWPHFWW